MPAANVLSRLKPYCQIGVCLLTVLLALNVALSALAATPVLGWLPNTVAGTGYLEDSRERVADALAEYRGGKLAASARLGAFVGISNVREGVELSTINAASGEAWRFLGLAGAGFGIGDVARYGDLLLSSELRPDLVVLGISLHQLVDRQPKPAAAPAGVLDYLRRGDVRNTAIALRNATWVYARRQAVNLAVEAALLEGRAAMFERFGVPLSDLQARRRSPWREMIKSDWPPHFSAATLREEEESYADRGFFKIETYRQAKYAPAALIRLVQQFRERQATVVILLMPEHSTLARRIPAEALDVFQHHLSEAFGDSPPPVLDLRRSIGDDGLVDLVHLNRSGSGEFSRLLAGRIQQTLPTGPALMAHRPGDHSATSGQGSSSRGSQ